MAGLRGYPGLAAIAAALLLAACAARYQPMGPAVGAPRMTEEAVVAADGYRLPLRVWRPEDGGPEPQAVVLALHGFNDHSAAFAEAAETWADEGVVTYAYDQRGFGRAAEPGIWPGADTMTADLAAAARLVRARHPGLPLYLAGESMGAAVILAALAGEPPPPADGAVLVAPAVWGRQDMSVFARVALWWAATAAPGMTLTGEGLEITTSDNVDMLRALARDPLVIKETRADAIAGLVDLMERGAAAASEVDRPVLVLYGDNEEVIPHSAIARFLERLPPDRAVVAFYPEGYHLLLRDLARDVPIGDVAHWVTGGGGRLPSGHERRRPDFPAEIW
jgi:alpha-beta hydrolase superfamily lysophospholipase